MRLDLGLQQRWVGVACLGWSSESLIDQGFYPADVPKEWHLTYYANFITATVLPPTLWQVASAEQIGEWCDQTQENFWFYLQCDTHENLTQARLRAADFGHKLAGMIVPPALEHLESVEHETRLVIGREVFVYDYPKLKQATADLKAWLHLTKSQPHNLVLMSPRTEHQAQDVQTLLELLGVQL